MSIDDDFRLLVWPVLRAQARAWARSIAQGDIPPSVALDFLCREAVWRGATYRDEDADCYDLEADLVALLADLTEAELLRGETNERDATATERNADLARDVPTGPLR